MKTRFLLIPVLIALSVHAAAPVTETALSRRYAEVRSRIDALFQHRDSPPPPITFGDNPFLVGSSSPADESDAAPGTEAVPSRGPAAPTFTRLQLIVSTFRITGLVRIGGASQLVINSAPRKPGELISVMWQGSPVFIKVSTIEPGLVTFELDGERVAVRY